MKIVILDSFAANPGDISWEPWENLSSSNGSNGSNGSSSSNGSGCSNVEFTAYDRTAPEQAVERAKDAEMVLTNKVVIDKEVMEQLPKLKYIGVLATGYNVVDIEEAHKRGIIVTNIPAYSTQSVAQLVIAHLLHIVNNVAAQSESVHKGEWANNADFSYQVTPQHEMAGRVFGVYGLGNTGSATAKVANALGMKVMAYTSKTQSQLPEWITKASSLEEFFRTADVVSLHCPLTPATKHLINKEHLALMKPTAIVLNTGRGPLVDDQALADALNEGRIYAAGIDVMTQEPPRDGSPLLTAKNCHITPHVAWATAEARQRLWKIALENVKAFIAGKPQNEV